MVDAALLIDNSNLYHTLKCLQMLPFPAKKYDELFSKLEELDFHLKRITMYDSIKNSSVEPEQYAAQQVFHESIKSLNDKWPIDIKTRSLKYRKLHEGGFVPFEKGIDVLIAVDALILAKRGGIGAIILLTGDSDFVPAIELIKEECIEVINLHTYNGSSKELREACNRHILIDFDENKNIILKLYKNTNELMYTNTHELKKLKH